MFVTQTIYTMLKFKALSISLGA